MPAFDKSNLTRGGIDDGVVPEVSPPIVTILIPVHDRLELTSACLDSIFATADPSVPFEIIVVDDGSTDGTDKYLESLGPRVRILQNESRKCFSEKMNMAAPLACGEYLCFLNNDTLVTNGWLKNLLTAARDNPTIGIVGNRHLTPGTDLINHAGMVFDSHGYPMHLYLGQPADFRHALISQEFQILTAACWLLKKRTFLEAGGFDPAFKNGWEDVDFCLRARRDGWKVFYAANSVIYHHGLSTMGRKDHETANAEYFKSRWGASIVPDLDNYYVVPPPPAPRIPSDIETRYSHVKTLQARHPLTASILRAIIRFATGVAKRLNRSRL
jgi:O-antigen biosynthesis protein